MINEKDVLHLLSLVREDKQSEAFLYAESMVSNREQCILEELERLINDMRSSNFTNDANQLAKTELANVVVFRCKDALEQLDYLKVKGAETAERTLTLVDNIHSSLTKLKRIDAVEDSVVEDIANNLLELTLSQTHQDLSEQVISKIVNFVEILETVLAQIVDLNLADEIETTLGPSVTSREKVFAVDGQNEIDSLIEKSVS